MSNNSQKRSDEGFLNRLVRVKAPGDGLDGLINPYLDVYTLDELVCKIGVYAFIETFLNEKSYFVTDGVDGLWHKHSVQLRLIDYGSGRQINALGALKVINRFYDLDLYMLRPRKTGRVGRRWRTARRYRNAARMAVLALSKAVNCEEMEPPIRAGYIGTLRGCYESYRSTTYDKSWKRYRKTQYK